MLISRAKIKDLPVAAEGYKLINQDGTSIYNGYNYTLDGKVVGTVHQETLYDKGVYGFYFCPDLIDCYKFYSLNPEYLIIKVRAYGKIDKNEGNKSIRAEILEIVDTRTFEEGIDIITQEKEVFNSVAVVDGLCIINSEGVVDGSIIHKSKGISVSSIIDRSCGVYDSGNIFNSSSVYQSEKVKESMAITVCEDIIFSQAIIHSKNIKDSTGVVTGFNVENSLGIENSDYIKNSRAIVDSSFVENSYGINESAFILNAAALDNCCFCSGVKGLIYGFCNKEISKQTWNKINKQIYLFINKLEDFESLIDKLSQYEGFDEKMVRAIGEQLLCYYY